MNVLYVAHDKDDPSEMCPGSTVCLALVNEIKEGYINVQDCDILSQTKALPDWLNGTPIVINDEDGIAHRGKDAIKKLRQFSQLMPRASDSSQSEPASDLFSMTELPPQSEASSKVTEEDLQRFMELRKQSPAGKASVAILPS